MSSPKKQNIFSEDLPEPSEFLAELTESGLELSEEEINHLKSQFDDPLLYAYLYSQHLKQKQNADNEEQQNPKLYLEYLDTVNENLTSVQQICTLNEAGMTPYEGDSEHSGTKRGGSNSPIIEEESKAEYEDNGDKLDEAEQEVQEISPEKEGKALDANDDKIQTPKAQDQNEGDEEQEELDEINDEIAALEAHNELLNQQIDGVESQIKDYEEYLDSLGDQQEELRGIKDESVKEVKNICLQLKIQFEDLLKGSMKALDYESTSNILLQTKIANEYLKQEKSLMADLVDQMIDLKRDIDKLYRGDTNKLNIPPELVQAKDQSVQYQMEDFLLDSNLFKLTEVIQYFYDNVYDGDIMKFDISSYKKQELKSEYDDMIQYELISEKDYAANIKEWDYKISEKMISLRRALEKEAQYKIEQFLVTSDSKFEKKKAINADIEIVRTRIMEQRERLSKAQTFLENEQLLVQNGYDQEVDNYNQVNDMFEKLKQTNESFQRILQREGSGDAVSSRDEYLVNLYYLMKDVAQTYQEYDQMSTNRSIRDDNVIIMKDDITKVASFLIKKKNESTELNKQTHIENLREVRKICSDVRRALLQLRNFDKQYADEEEVSDLSEAWKTQHSKLIQNKQELDSTINELLKTLSGQLDSNITDQYSREFITFVNENLTKLRYR